MEAAAGEERRRGSDGRGRGRGRGRHRHRGGGRGRGVYAKRHATDSDSAKSASPVSSIGSSPSRPASANRPASAQKFRSDIDDEKIDALFSVPATAAAPTAAPAAAPAEAPSTDPAPEPEPDKQPEPGTEKAENGDMNSAAEQESRQAREAHDEEELRKTEEAAAAGRIQAAHRGRQGRARADGVRKRLGEVAPPADGDGNDGGDANGTGEGGATAGVGQHEVGGGEGGDVASEQAEKQPAPWGPADGEVWFTDKFTDDLFDAAHVVRLALRVGEDDAALAHGAEGADPSFWNTPQRAWAAPGHYPVLSAAQIKKLGNQRRRLEFATLRYVQLGPLSTLEELQRLRTDAAAAPPARSTTAGVGIERVPVLTAALKSALGKARTGSAVIASHIQADAERVNASDVAQARREQQKKQGEVDAAERRSRAHAKATKAQVAEHERLRRHEAHQQKVEQTEQEKRRAFDTEMQQRALEARRGSGSKASAQAETEAAARRTEEARRANYDERRTAAQADEQKRLDAYQQAKKEAAGQAKREDDEAQEREAAQQAEFEATMAKHSEARAKFAPELDERLRKLDPVLSDLEEACQKACVGMIDMHGMRLSQTKVLLTKLERGVELENRNVDELASAVSGADFGAMVRPLRQRMDDVLHTALTKLPEAVKLLPSARESDPLTMKAATDDFLQWNEACLGALVCTREVEQVLVELRQEVVLERQRQAEAQERHEMEHEERHTRVLVRIMKIRNKQQLQRKLFLSVCRREWHKACAQRVDDERRAKDAERAAQEAEEQERQNVAQRAEDERDARDARHHSPWQAVKDGCRVATLDRLIGEEAKRRRNQQGRVLTDADGNTKISGVAFHVDDPDHVTGECLLRNACWWGHLHLVQHLLKMGADPDRIDSACSRTTPLHEAARGGYGDICAALLEAGARRDTADGGGDTPLHWAARVGHSSVVRVLLRLTPREVEIESTTGSMTPLWRSLEMRNHKGLRAADLARSRAVDSIMAGKMAKLPERQAAQAEAEADAKRRRQARRQKKRDALAAKRASDPAAAVSSEMALQEQQATLALSATTGSAEGRKKKKKKKASRKKSVA